MKVLWDTIARQCGIQIVGARQVSSTVLIDSAVTGKSARDLADAVRPEVKADTGVFVTDGCEGFALVINTDKRDYEFVRNSLVVRIFTP